MAMLIIKQGSVDLLVCMLSAHCVGRVFCSGQYPINVAQGTPSLQCHK